MRKRETYCKHFENEDAATERAAMKNRACRLANNFADIYCVVDGPDNDYSVVDLTTAIDLGMGYFIPN